MAALDHIPREMLDQILSLLPTADLTHTSLVSHRLWEVSQPLLYKAPVLLWAGHRTQRQCLQIFLWTLLTPGREALAAEVRSLTWYRYPDQPVLCPSMNALIAPVAARFGLHHSLDLQADLFVLLLHLLPCLRVIRIKNSEEFTLFAYSNRHSTALSLPLPTLTPLLLQYLREFHSPDRGARGRNTHQTLFVLLALPCIRLVDVRIDNKGSSSVPAVHAPAASSTVTHLRIWDRCEAPAYLSRILNATPELTHFSYCTTTHCSRFNLAMFWAAMQPLSRSVVCLHLDVCLMGPQNRDWVAWFGCEETTLSLVEWVSLRTLSCTLVGVMGKRTPAKIGGFGAHLPSGVREVEILGKDPDWRYAARVEELAELLAGKDVAVPHLLMVVMEEAERVVKDEGDEVALVNLRGASAQAGVTLGSTSHRW